MPKRMTRASRRFTESDVRKQVLRGLKAAGIYAEPLEDKIRRGIPDVYIDGGRWLELKHKVLVARGRGANVLKEFTDYQKHRLLRREFKDTRDSNYAGIMFSNPEGRASFFICRFAALYSVNAIEDRCMWNFGKAERWGVSYEAIPYYVAGVFGPWERMGMLHSHLELVDGYPASRLLAEDQ